MNLPMKITESLEADDVFLRELHHRIRNNFQTITSLISLRARTLPGDQRSELRFVEEHVQAMAAAYRIVRVTERKVEVVFADLVADVVNSLRQIAGVPRDLLALELATGACVMRIDQAIALSLYLATLLPPYLDAGFRAGATLRIEGVALDAEWMRLSVHHAAPLHELRQDLLRHRLVKIYLGQLGAQLEPSDDPGITRVRIHVPPRE